MLLQIFKKSTLLLGAGSMLFFTSCNEDGNEKADRDNTATETKEDHPRKLKKNTNQDNKDLEVNPMDDAQNQPLQNEPSQNNSSTGGEDVKINPPHGEPGHDCAVPVGQPLSSGSSNQSGPVIEQESNLNPPHGEPGHDCAVPVGQPLN